MGSPRRLCWNRGALLSVCFIPCYYSYSVAGELLFESVDERPSSPCRPANMATTSASQRPFRSLHAVWGLPLAWGLLNRFGELPNNLIRRLCHITPHEQLMRYASSRHSLWAAASSFQRPSSPCRPANMATTSASQRPFRSLPVCFIPCYYSYSVAGELLFESVDAKRREAREVHTDLYRLLRPRRPRSQHARQTHPAL
jgi:hypothetical protein